LAYNQNIPQPTDQLKVSQADILANFQALKTLIDVNHETFGATGEGKHKFVQMPEQGAAPTTAANEGGLYTAEGATTAVSQLYFRRENDGIKIPITEGTLPGVNFGITNGFAFLGSGLLLKFGNVNVASIPANSILTKDIDISATGPAFTFISRVFLQMSYPTAAADYRNREVFATAITGTTTTSTLKVEYINSGGQASSAGICSYFVLGATNLT